MPREASRHGTVKASWEEGGGGGGAKPGAFPRPKKPSTMITWGPQARNIKDGDQQVLGVAGADEGAGAAEQVMHPLQEVLVQRAPRALETAQRLQSQKRHLLSPSEQKSPYASAAK